MVNAFSTQPAMSSDVENRLSSEASRALYRKKAVNGASGIITISKLGRRPGRANNDIIIWRYAHQHYIRLCISSGDEIKRMAQYMTIWRLQTRKRKLCGGASIISVNRENNAASYYNAENNAGVIISISKALHAHAASEKL